MGVRSLVEMVILLPLIIMWYWFSFGLVVGGFLRVLRRAFRFGQEGQTSPSLQGHKAPRQAIYHTTYFICLLRGITSIFFAELKRVLFSPPANPTPTLCAKCTCRQTVQVLDRSPPPPPSPPFGPSSSQTAQLTGAARMTLMSQWMVLVDH